MDKAQNYLPAGTILHGKSYNYCIEKFLDQGSFGITYLASVKMAGALGTIDANIKVAIKEFFMRDVNGRSGTTVTTGSKSDLYNDYKRKFAREATNLSKLSHPNIVKVLELFKQNDTIYYSMEYIDGGSLDDYIRNKTRLSENEAVRAIKQIGEAISFMHSKGMLHLDLKPRNVMRKSDGNYVLIDFGLSKQYDERGNPESSTTIGTGTQGYSPIEQAYYHDSKDFPVTMDVYALGGTMFKMLTGKRPPEASQILNDGFPLYELQEHNVSDSLSACIAKAMAPMKKNRCQSVSEFLNALDNEDIVIVDVAIADEKVVGTKRGMDNHDSDDTLVLRKGTGKVRIEYYPSIYSGKEEYIREISNNQVRYIHGHNLYSPVQKGEERWLSYGISNENYRSFLTNLEQLNLRIDPNGALREEWGTDNTRLKIVLYDEKGKVYKTIWKYSWSDEYGGGECGRLEGRPEDIYGIILNIIPQKEKKHGKRSKSDIPVLGNDLEVTVSATVADVEKAVTKPKEKVSQKKQKKENVFNVRPDTSTIRAKDTEKAQNGIKGKQRYIHKLPERTNIYALTSIVVIILYYVLQPWDLYIKNTYGGFETSRCYDYANPKYVLRMEQGGRGGVFYKPGNFWAVEPNYMRSNPEQVYDVYDDSFTIEGLEIGDQCMGYAAIIKDSEVGLFFCGKQILPYESGDIQLDDYDTGYVKVHKDGKEALFDSKKLF